MAKIALLIGVSEYKSGLTPLPSAIKDVEAMRRVLQNPEIGAFASTDVRVLKNPDRQTMEEAIEMLFSGRQKDDLILLFFSGHGIRDNDTRRFYLATCNTRESSLRSTAVASSFVHDCMNESRSKRKVVILDSCFSGAFVEGLSAKDSGAIDIWMQLGGEGRAILASSGSVEYSFEKKGLDLSVYTHCLIDGMTTGAADQNGDGFISVDELHEYAKRRVQEIHPAMRPEIHAGREGYTIKLIKVRGVADPKLTYHREVESCAREGEISSADRKRLDMRRLQLGLSLGDATQIENGVLIPYRERQEKLRHYKEAYTKAAEYQFPLHATHRDWLDGIQTRLALQKQDIQAIRQEVDPPFEQKLKAKYQENLAQYEQELLDILRQEYPLSERSRSWLNQQQHSLQLSDEDVEKIEKPILEEKQKSQDRYRINLDYYKEWFIGAALRQYPLKGELHVQKIVQRQYGIKDEDALQVEEEFKANPERFRQQEKQEDEEKLRLQREQAEKLRLQRDQEKAEKLKREAQESQLRREQLGSEFLLYEKFGKIRNEEFEKIRQEREDERWREQEERREKSERMLQEFSEKLKKGEEMRLIGERERQADEERKKLAKEIVDEQRRRDQTN